MDFSSIKRGLEDFVERYDSQTFLGSYRETSRSSLLITGLATRANSLWKMAEFVVAKYDNTDTPLGNYINGWKQLASSSNNQYLLLEENHNLWGIYNAQGIKLGGEDYILNFFSERKKQKKQEIHEPELDYSPNGRFCHSRQVIYYGAPGTGKSNTIKEIVDNQGEICFRTTFHPDSDYSTFVGCYKPRSHKKNMLEGNGYSLAQLLSRFFDSYDQKYQNTKKARYLYESLVNAKDIKSLGLDADSISNKLKAQGFKGCAYTTEATCMYNIYDWLKEDGYIVENKITYEFTPQAFTLAYVEAWKQHKTQTPVYLIIEEINRGNCAQIFGDLFQLLDRDDNGYSRYDIIPDTDLREFIAEQGLDISGVINSKGEDISSKISRGEILKLPKNLYIWATMNTSDQSLFPIDSAFKRRWDWQYMPIGYKNTNWIIEIGDEKYKWVKFQRIINKKIYEVDSSEDKKLGDYFVNADRTDGKITADTLLNKVLFYLWNDVCKDDPDQIFRWIDDKKEEKSIKFSEFFEDDKEKKLQGFMAFLKVPELGESSEEEKPEEIDETEETEREEGASEEITE